MIEVFWEGGLTQRVSGGRAGETHRSKDRRRAPVRPCGPLTLKWYTKGERVTRFEAIVHNTRALNTGRTLDKFPVIVARLAGMTDRFISMLDCVHIEIGRASCRE